MSDQLGAIRTRIEPVLTARGIDLEDIAVQRAGQGSVLRVLVDRDGGVDLDTIAEVSREISAVLDAEADLIPPRTTLEVGSPGVDRPLTHERHWRRAATRLVEVTPTDGDAFTDRVEGIDADVVTFISGRTIPLADVLRAIVQVEFGGKDGH
jgi:ribosome maturation factor RimP